MAVMKLSSSKKQLQIIADDGTVYVTSVSYARSLLYGHMPAGLVLLSKYPEKASPDRFKQSPVYDPSGKYTEMVESDCVGKDALSSTRKEERKQERTYKTDITDF